MLVVTDCLKDVYELLTAPELTLNGHISAEEVLKTINRLLNGKAVGPNRILNEVLKRITLKISAGLMQGIHTAFTGDLLPAHYKESTTIILCKEGKKDYLLLRSYRPIALKNMLVKIVEKVLATHLSCAAEEHSLLFWTQMKAKRDRSIASALGLLTLCIQTVWCAKSGSIVSMLSLNLSETFNNIPHDKLLSILCQKDLPEWLVWSVKCFLSVRHTHIAYTEHKSDWIKTNINIPQSSPLSLILFLFFISGLLKQFKDPEKRMLDFEFIDDTYLITWGINTSQNCCRLTAAHI